MDLGSCSGTHDLALRADYENAAREKDFFYDVDVSMRRILYPKSGCGLTLRVLSRNENYLR